MIFIFSPFWLSHLIMQKEPFHFLRFEKDSQYCELRLNKDLLDDWTLTTHNGRIKSKIGQSRIQAFTTFNDALKQLYVAIELRHQKCYQMKHHIIEDVVYCLLLYHFCSYFLHTKPRMKQKKLTIPNANKKQSISHDFFSNQGCFVFH